MYTCTASVPTTKNWQVTFSEPDTVPSASIESLMFGNGVFVFTDIDNFYNSTDGTTWTVGAGTAPGVGGCSLNFVGPATNEGFFYYTCEGGVAPVQVSMDGYNWTQILQAGMGDILGISFAYFNGQYQYIATGGDGKFLTSTDGFHFTKGSPINHSTAFDWVASGYEDSTVAVSYADNSIYTNGAE